MREPSESKTIDELINEINQNDNSTNVLRVTAAKSNLADEIKLNFNGLRPAKESTPNKAYLLYEKIAGSSGSGRVKDHVEFIHAEQLQRLLKDIDTEVDETAIAQKTRETRDHKFEALGNKSVDECEKHYKAQFNQLFGSQAEGINEVKVKVSPSGEIEGFTVKLQDNRLVGILKEVGDRLGIQIPKPTRPTGGHYKDVYVALEVPQENIERFVTVFDETLTSKIEDKAKSVKQTMVSAVPVVNEISKQPPKSAAQSLATPQAGVSTPTVAPSPIENKTKSVVGQPLNIKIHFSPAKLKTAIQKRLLPEKTGYMDMVSQYFECDGKPGSFTLKKDQKGELILTKALVDELRRNAGSYQINGVRCATLITDNKDETYDVSALLNMFYDNGVLKGNEEQEKQIVFSLLTMVQGGKSKHEGPNEGIKKSANLSHMGMGEIVENLDMNLYADQNKEKQIGLNIEKGKIHCFQISQGELKKLIGIVDLPKYYCCYYFVDNGNLAYLKRLAEENKPYFALIKTENSEGPPSLSVYYQSTSGKFEIKTLRNEMLEWGEEWTQGFKPGQPDLSLRTIFSHQAPTLYNEISFQMNQKIDHLNEKTSPKTLFKNKFEITNNLEVLPNENFLESVLISNEEDLRLLQEAFKLSGPNRLAQFAEKNEKYKKVVYRFLALKEAIRLSGHDGSIEIESDPSHAQQKKALEVFLDAVSQYPETQKMLEAQVSRKISSGGALTPFENLIVERVSAPFYRFEPFPRYLNRVLTPENKDKIFSVLDRARAPRAQLGRAFSDLPPPLGIIEKTTEIAKAELEKIEAFRELNPHDEDFNESVKAISDTKIFQEIWQKIFPQIFAILLDPITGKLKPTVKMALQEKYPQYYDSWEKNLDEDKFRREVLCAYILGPLTFPMRNSPVDTAQNKPNGIYFTGGLFEQAGNKYVHALKNEKNPNVGFRIDDDINAWCWTNEKTVSPAAIHFHQLASRDYPTRVLSLYSMVDHVKKNYATAEEAFEQYQQFKDKTHQGYIKHDKLLLPAFRVALHSVDGTGKRDAYSQKIVEDMVKDAVAPSSFLSRIFGPDFDKRRNARKCIKSLSLEEIYQLGKEKEITQNQAKAIAHILLSESRFDINIKPEGEIAHAIVAISQKTPMFFESFLGWKSQAYKRHENAVILVKRHSLNTNQSVPKITAALMRKPDVSEKVEDENKAFVDIFSEVIEYATKNEQKTEYVPPLPSGKCKTPILDRIPGGQNLGLRVSSF